MAEHNMGRGRGESSKMAAMEVEELAGTRYSRPASSRAHPLEVDMDEDSNSGSSSSGEQRVIRGRAGFRSKELCTIPANLAQAPLKAAPTSSCQQIDLLSNFIRIKPMPDKHIYSYRVDFEPNVESSSLRGRLLRIATKDVLGVDLLFDGVSEARSTTLIDSVREFNVEHPKEPDTFYKIMVKKVATVSPGSFEMLRLYNMNMRKCLEAMGFFQVSKSGAYVHPSLATPIGQEGTIVACRGFKTAVNVHEDGEIMMKLEACHKLMQRKNALRYMEDIRVMPGDFRANLKTMLTGKLLVTSYNKIMYKIEDINYELTPMSGFPDRKTGKNITFKDYFKQRYDVTIEDDSQPLLLVVQSNRRRLRDDEGEGKEIYVVPELCNIAGLTDQQRNDNRLKVDLIKSSQISPKDRVEHMETFMRKLRDSSEVFRIIRRWGYSYDQKPVGLKGRLLPMESVGLGKMASDRKSWPKADALTGSFEQKVMRESLAKAPELPRLAIILPRINPNQRQIILNRLRQGFQKVGLEPGASPKVFDLDGDSTQQYIQIIRGLPDCVTIIIAVLHSQNKDRYDAIKKLASVERGLVTQVVTAKLLLDERKANGASTKIGIQVAAKIGGEPWYIDIPLVGDMICGYDTYHDTANRGRSYGAFIASLNPRFSRWFSKADSHDMLDELSSHLAENLACSLRRFREANNNKVPKRIFIYRDGVGEGQLEHVYKLELQQVRKAFKDFESGIKLTFIIVNKAVGARFYMQNNGSFGNPSPGSVIDNTITRKERYDFYLISQSTRNGTVAPTYYNIVYDESSLDAAKHQMLAFKLCFLYYNWTGTVRVPAPCQYAHKLALLCGEHLHAIPNANLDNRLHFL